jgi:hypothetical protein
MKKVFLALAAIAMVAAMSSCKKVCDCTTYLAGDEGTTYEYTVSQLQTLFPEIDVKKCSDVSTVEDTELLGKNGTVCK